MFFQECFSHSDFFFSENSSITTIFSNPSEVQLRTFPKKPTSVSSKVFFFIIFFRNFLGILGNSSKDSSKKNVRIPFSKKPKIKANKNHPQTFPRNSQAISSRRSSEIITRISKRNAPREKHLRIPK